MESRYAVALVLRLAPVSTFMPLFGLHTSEAPSLRGIYIEITVLSLVSLDSTGTTNRAESLFARKVLRHMRY